MHYYYNPWPVNDIEHNIGYIYKAVTMLKQREKELKESYSLKSFPSKSLCILPASVILGLRPKDVAWDLFQDSPKTVKQKKNKCNACSW